MNITLDLYSSAQLRAFAIFLNACAEEHDRQVKDKEAYALGGINRDGLKGVWKNSAEVGDGEQTATQTDEPSATQTSATAPTRKRGEPSPGHKRRTKAEIAEDDAAEKTEVAANTPAAISTGAERVAPDDEPEVEQQDVVDEADETAKAGAELSHENLRDSLGKYVQKFGMDAAQLDGPKLFALVFKNPAITKISAVPSDQASLKAALDGINEMLAKNPFDRAPVA